METTHRKSGYGSVSLIRDRTVTVIDEMNDLGETLLVRAILITCLLYTSDAADEL